MRAEGQIYIKNNVAGRSVYTKLQDVLKFNNESTRGEYENLEKAVNQNYENYNKKNLPTYTNTKKQSRHKPNISTTTIKSTLPLMTDYSPDKRAKRRANLGFMIVKGNSSQDLLIRSFKRAIADSSSEFLNKNKCVTEIDENFHVIGQIIPSYEEITNLKSNMATQIESEEKLNEELQLPRGSKDEGSDPPKANAYDSITKSPITSISPENGKNMTDDFKLKNTTISVVSIKSGDTTSKKKSKLSTSTKLTKKKSTPHKKVLFPMFGLKSVLQSALFYLHINKITIRDYHEHKVIPISPYSCQSKLKTIIQRVI